MISRYQLFGSALLAGTLGCQNHVDAPTLDLPPSTDTLTLASGALTEGAWLHDAVWAVLSPDDATVWLVDFEARTITPVGEGGRNYRNPFGLFASADTLFINDWGMGRTTMWTSDGRLADSFPTTDATRGTLPRARDEAGRFYVAVRPHPGPDGRGNEDSAAVLRTDDRLQHADTIAMLAPFDLEEVFGDAGRRFERRVFSGEDAWGVLPDGTLWVARVRHNRVWWYDGDQELLGEMLPDPVWPVTQADREVFLRRFPEGLRGTAERLPFAQIKPPFRSGVMGSDGMIWLEKSRQLSDTVQMYHRVGRDGNLEALIRLPLPARILAVSPTGVLVEEPVVDGVRLWQFSNVQGGAQASPDTSMTTLPK